MSTAPRMLLDWPAFMADPQVRSMPILSRGIYLLLLGEMWMNEGWLPNDDRLIAGRLQLDVRAWRKHRSAIAPCLTEVSGTSSTLPCGMVTQKRLTREYQIALDLIAKRKAQTAPARARRAGKPAYRPSVTERPNGRKTEHVSTPVTSAATEPAATPETAGNTPSKRERTLPIKQVESSLSRDEPITKAEPPAGPAHDERLVPAERVTGLMAALTFKPMPKGDD